MSEVKQPTVQKNQDPLNFSTKVALIFDNEDHMYKWIQSREGKGYELGKKEALVNFKAELRKMLGVKE